MHAHQAAPPSGEGRPRLEVADIFRAHGDSYRLSHALPPSERSVMRAIEICRTPALGGHLDKCDQCDYAKPAYNSCRNRHCPKCQALRQAQWIAERMERILPTHYFHVVFTLPAELRPLVMRNKVVLYDLLFHAASRTLLDLGQDPKRLGGQLGITAVLHTWTRDLQFHPHLHCIVTGGGLSEDGLSWVPTGDNFLFPVKVMRRLFRAKFLAGLARARDDGVLDLGGSCAGLADPVAFAYLKNVLYTKDWVVYAKPPFGGPEHVYQYLGRYTHRVAISNQRCIAMDATSVRFATKDGRTATLKHHEFIRRFLLHILPRGFVKIRHFGLMAPGNIHTKLVTARRLLEPNRVPRGLAILFLVLHFVLSKTGPSVAVAADLLASHADTKADADFADFQLSCRSCPSCGKGVLRAFPLPAPLSYPASSSSSAPPNTS
jgi:hypothetical protein